MNLVNPPDTRSGYPFPGSSSVASLGPLGPGRSWSGKSSCRFPLSEWPWPRRTPHVTPARGPDWPARCSSSQLVSVLSQLVWVSWKGCMWQDSDQYGHLENVYVSHILWNITRLWYWNRVLSNRCTHARRTRDLTHVQANKPPLDRVLAAQTHIPDGIVDSSSDQPMPE